jgi:hypothetical protein
MCMATCKVGGAAETKTLVSCAKLMHKKLTSAGVCQAAHERVAVGDLVVGALSLGRPTKVNTMNSFGALKPVDEQN